MALGAITTQAALSGGANASAPLRFDRMSFAGDGAYVAGGTAFEALVQAAVGAHVTILGVITHLAESGGYVLDYNASTGKLLTYVTNGAGGVLVEDATANQSGRTYEITVISI